MLVCEPAVPVPVPVVALVVVVEGGFVGEEQGTGHPVRTMGRRTAAEQGEDRFSDAGIGSVGSIRPIHRRKEGIESVGKDRDR